MQTREQALAWISKWQLTHVIWYPNLPPWLQVCLSSLTKSRQVIDGATLVTFDEIPYRELLKSELLSNTSMQHGRGKWEALHAVPVPGQSSGFTVSPGGYIDQRIQGPLGGKSALMQVELRGEKDSGSLVRLQVCWFRADGKVISIWQIQRAVAGDAPATLVEVTRAPPDATAADVYVLNEGGSGPVYVQNVSFRR